MFAKLPFAIKYKRTIHIGKIDKSNGDSIWIRFSAYIDSVKAHDNLKYYPNNVLYTFVVPSFCVYNFYL